MKLLLTFLLLTALTACHPQEVIHPAASYECKSLRLTPGSAPYNDCVRRLSAEERALERAQGR